MKLDVKRLAIASLVTSMWAVAAQATPIQAVSYDMQNGETGSFTYWDDSYDGSGSTTTSLAPLSGGLGDLTDGVIATSNWSVTPGPYVGWSSIDPVINFHFGGIVNIETVTLYFADSNGAGGVSTPGSVSIDGDTFTIVDPPGAEPLAVTISNLGFTGSTLDIQLFEGTATWVFVSEVQFDGSIAQPTPEPAPLALFAVGLIGLALGRRRRK